MPKRTAAAPATSIVASNGHGEAPQPSMIQLHRIERGFIQVPVIGTSPLIVHRFDEKAKGMMLDAQTAGATKTRKKREPKDPIADYERSMYRFADGGHGVPAVAFKGAIVDSARLFDGVKMTELRAALLIGGEVGCTGPDQLVRLNASPRMREDTVRVGMGTADIRFRAEYDPWSAVLDITFVPSMISAESIVALVDAAGMGGIGEWRPGKSKTGSYGTFQVDADFEVTR